MICAGECRLRDSVGIGLSLRQARESGGGDVRQTSNVYRLLSIVDRPAAGWRHGVELLVSRQVLGGQSETLRRRCSVNQQSSLIRRDLEGRVWSQFEADATRGSNRAAYGRRLPLGLVTLEELLD